MSMPSRPWMRLARIATATVLSATGAVALVPSAATAAADDTVAPASAIVDEPGCAANVTPPNDDSNFDYVLTAPVGGNTRAQISNNGYVYIYAGGQAMQAGSGADLQTYGVGTPMTYGSITWQGRDALCVTWPDSGFYGYGAGPRVSQQMLLVDRSDVAPGAVDVVFNYAHVSSPQGLNTFVASGGYVDLPGNNDRDAQNDGNYRTGLAHNSRESRVAGRYVTRVRDGIPLLAPAPDTEITSEVPTDRLTTAPDLTYVASGSEDFWRFECRVFATGTAGGAFSACPDAGTTYDDLATGEWTFEVRAVDDLGGADLTPASADFTIDRTGPVTTIDSDPGALTNDNDPVFEFSSEDTDVASFECNLDRDPSAEPSPWYDCESGEDTGILGDGDWKFQVRGIDDLGNTGTAAEHAFTIDTDAPVVELTDKPAARGNDTTPVVAWTSADDVDLYECNLDRTGGEGSPWEECASGDELDVTDGDWTFQVRATDEAGNVGEPTSYDFTVDTEKSTVSITGKPAALGNDATPSFTYAADPSADLDHFVCVVVPVGAQFASPETCAASGFTSEPLEDGDYRFTVVAVDTAGNESDPAWFEFTVDTAAPETTVTDGPAATIATGSATFGFASSETPATFECRLSGAQQSAWETCAGSSRTFSGLADGTYTFEVRARDAAGNTDATPASRTVKVNLGQPTITAAITSPTPMSEFGWYRSPVTITYTCAGNGSALVGACPAPREVPRAQQGKVVFRASIATADGDTASVSTTLFIDKGKPQAKITGFSGKKSYSSMPKPRCRASDPRSGLDSCTVTVTKVKRKNGEVFVVVKAKAVDKAGNVRVVRKQAPFRAA